MDFNLKHFFLFEGEIQNLSTAKVKKGTGDLNWNKSLPIPLKNEETVYIHPDQSDVESGYTKIIQVGEGYKITTIFNKGMFTFD